jgi:hypothetical protein
MANFPALAPATRPVTPGAWGGTMVAALSGGATGVRQGSAEIGRRLSLTFASITEAQFLQLVSHYRGQRSGFDSFAFTTTTIPADYTPSGHQWLYAGPPQVVDQHADVFDVACEFRSEPRAMVRAGGADLGVTASLVAGVATGLQTGNANLSASASLTPGTASITTALTWATGVSDIAYSNSDSTITATATSEKTVRSTAAKSSDKWYAELSANLQVTGGVNSVADSFWGLAANNSAFPGQSGSGGIGLTGSRSPWQDGMGASLTGSTLYYSSGSARILMIAVDFSTKKLWFGVDGAWLDSGNPGSGANASASGWTGTPSWYVTFRPYFNTDAATLQTVTTYALPSGFNRWGDS